MNHALACVLMLMLTAPTYAQPDSLWSRYFGGPSLDEAQSVRQTTDGGYILAGSTYGGGSRLWDVLLLKLDASGNVQWSHIYGGPLSDNGSGVLQTADGGYVVAGYTANYGAGNYDAWLIKVAANGDSIWSQTYGGSLNDYVASLEPTADGGYIMGGTNLSFSNGYEDLWMVKTDGDGNLQWHHTYGESGFDFGAQARQTNDGGYIVAGYTDAQDGGTYIWVFKTNADGSEQWNYLLGDPVSPSYCYDIIQTDDGGYALCGWNYSGGLLIKIDASGNQQWQHLHNGTFTGLRQTSDGGYILTGDRWVTQYDLLLLRTDGVGDEQWSRAYVGSRQEHSYAFSPTEDGGYILAGTGENNGVGLYDLFVLKTTPDQMLPAPANLVIKAVNVDIQLTWNSVIGDNILYRIYEDPTSEGPFQNLVGTTEDTTFVVSNAVEQPISGKFYVVKAVTP